MKDIDTRFIQIAAARGHKRAVREIRQEFAREVVEDFEAGGRTKPPAVSANAAARHLADEAHVEASRRWMHLHDRTG